MSCVNKTIWYIAASPWIWHGTQLSLLQFEIPEHVAVNRGLTGSSLTQTFPCVFYLFIKRGGGEGAGEGRHHRPKSGSGLNPALNLAITYGARNLIRGSGTDKIVVLCNTHGAQ